MATRELKREEWREYFDWVSSHLPGEQVEIEVIGLDLGDQVEAEWLGLNGLSYDPKDDVLVVALEGLEHVIRAPRAVFVQEEGPLLASVEVIDSDGHKQVVKLRSPLALPSP